ncbi:nitronate monooxygenase [Agrococcus sp. ARC_14]|uniref:nitronate monooxygenase n=1 Tax=Agrococcus sp. ARC_14 TaxID=2919927 RepID=UPI001F05A992|nr:nitronate monooxygenase [Agrococcus sp. ARC_14]MCH1883357.1 nitronate monooxygenase [Agrococcus sp. ARC_14]
MHHGAPTATLPAPLDRSKPVVVAPMAGGPSSPALVAAATGAGHFAQLAGGYLSTDALRAQIDEVRSRGVGAFGVNLFVPNTHAIDPSAYERYWDALLADGAPHTAGVERPALREDDDEWGRKLELLLAERVPVVSFTFGLPEAGVFERLRAAGITSMQTVTSAAEAQQAERAGADVLVVQGAAAGGHSGVWAPHALPEELTLTALVQRVRAAIGLPIVAAGGVVRRAQVEELLAAGAGAVAVGTAVLRADEAGTSAVHRAALADPRFERTELTRAFTGRPARALVNRFVEAHRDAPSGYPAVHHMTRPLRAAAAAAGDASAVHLWAGEGWREARAGAVVDILAELTP